MKEGAYLDSKKKYVSQTDLINEWDFDKNEKNGLNPFTLSHGSTKKAFWICKEGHSFESRIDHRFIMGSGCPYCAGKKPVVGVNDLSTLNPELMREWDFEKNLNISPQQLMSASNRVVWWKCIKCGYSWKASIVSRTQRKTNCPECAKKQRTKTKRNKLVARKGSLLKNRPDLIKEWDYEKNNDIDPDSITEGYGKKVWWRCEKCGYLYSKEVCKRVSGQNCPACAGKQVFVGKNDLQSVFPNIAQEWNQTKNGDLKPNEVTIGSGKKVWWKCKKCSYEFTFNDLLTNFERVSDHCSNIGGLIIELSQGTMDVHKYLKSVKYQNEDFIQRYNEYSSKYIAK